MGEIRIGFDVVKKPIPPEVLDGIEASRVRALAEAECWREHWFARSHYWLRP